MNNFYEWVVEKYLPEGYDSSDKDAYFDNCKADFAFDISRDKEMQKKYKYETDEIIFKYLDSKTYSNDEEEDVNIVNKTFKELQKEYLKEEKYESK